jgi:hypothetical protein
MFLGVNNRRPPTSLYDKDKGGRYLADALNVDVDNDGSLLRRVGVTRFAEIAGAHSLHQGMVVIAGALCAIDLPDPTTSLLRLLSTNNPMSYATVADGRLYFSNGTDGLRRTAGGAIVPWALPAPSAPTLVEIPGALSTGRYRVALSFSDGEHEGALSEMSLIEATGVRVTLPAAPEGATHINVYITGNDGDVPLLHSTLEVGDATFDIATAPEGRAAILEHEAPLPAGTRIFEHNGRLCSVVGKTLYFSQPYRYGYYLPSRGSVTFPSNITCAAGAHDGIYVATDSETCYIAGRDLDSVEIVWKPIGRFGAVPGTEFDHPDKKISGWFSTKGVAILNPGGELELPMIDSVDVDDLPARAVTSLITTDGRDRVVSCGWCLNLGTGAATRYDDFDFTSWDAGYATKADGIYEIDTAAAAPYEVDFGLENFGTSEEKSMPAMYLGAQSDEALAVSIGTVEGDFEYSARTFSADSLATHRVDPGLGLRDNYFHLKLIGSNGGDFILASVEFAPAKSNRRV